MKYRTSMLALMVLAVSGTFSFATAECQPPSQEEMEATKTALFAEADADHNGQLTLEEFATFRDLLEDGRTNHIFTCIDTNGDESISAEELAAHKPPQYDRGNRRGQGGQRPF